MQESALREQMAMHGRSLYDRAAVSGSSGKENLCLYTCSSWPEAAER